MNPSILAFIVRFRRVPAACLSILLLSGGIAHAQTLTVLYPAIGEPYRAVFAEIIEGIEELSKAKVRGIALGDDPGDLRATLKQGKVVIALGRRGLQAADTLDAATDIVVGGVGAVPDGDRGGHLSGISLTPDPALLFGLLKKLLPAARRVIVIYDPRSNEPLIRLAREAARAHRLELVALEASTLAGAARIYEAQLAGADGRRDALWLPQDAVSAEETTILPLVLKQSWRRNLPVFSSSVLHVKKGALFGVYPDHLQLGRDLAVLALALQNGEPSRRGVTPLRAVRTALNIRTAGHLGIELVAGQQRNFDAIFPLP